MHIIGIGEDGLSIPEPQSLREQQLQALAQIHGIWKDGPEIEAVIKELEQGWEQWCQRLEES